MATFRADARSQPHPPRRAGSRSRTSARRWTAAATPPRPRSATACRWSRASSATATRCWARPCASRAPASGAGARWRSSRRGNDWWAGAFPVDRAGRWRFQVAGWVDRYASWRHELSRKVEAGQEDLSSELAEGAQLLGVRVADRRAGARRTTESDRSEETASPVLELDVDRERARFGSWYELFPRSWGGFAGVTEGAASARRARLRRRLPAARAPDRHDEPQGPEQRARGRAGRPGQPVGDRRRGGRARRRAPGARARSRSSSAWSRSGARPAARSCIDLAIQCSPDHPWLKRAPGLVPPPPGRHAQVRREPAQEVSRHLQRQLGLGRLEGHSGRSSAASSSSGSTAASRCSASTTRTPSPSPSGSG